MHKEHQGSVGVWRLGFRILGFKVPEIHTDIAAKFKRPGGSENYITEQGSVCSGLRLTPWEVLRWALGDTLLVLK